MLYDHIRNVKGIDHKGLHIIWRNENNQMSAHPDMFTHTFVKFLINGHK